MPGYAVIDTETTGFSPRTGDRIIEIAVVRLDLQGEVVDTWETLLNPDRPVGATHVHGLTAEAVAHAPRFTDVAEHVAALVSGHVIVGHNVDFDMRFLENEFALARFPFHAPGRLCTQKLAATYLPGPKRTLAVCCEQAGIVNDHAHSALGDTIATAELFRHYLRHHPDGVPWADVVAAAAASVAPADDLFAELFDIALTAPRTLSRSALA